MLDRAVSLRASRLAPSPPAASVRLRRLGRRVACLTLSLGTALVALPALADSASESSEAAAMAEADASARAQEIAQRSYDAMGGDDGFAAAPFLRFNFFGFRTHHWDREAGRHRFEGATREGQTYIVLLDLNSRGSEALEGSAWLDGEALDGEAKAEWLERAWSAWINDTYWLLMPAKLQDPGVHLEAQGTETIDGVRCDKLQITFGEVGLTPGDTYWAWFDRESGLMRRWAYHLESWEAERPATAWNWTDWQAYGPLTLSETRVPVPAEGEEAGETRSLSNIEVFSSLPDSVFTDPGPVAAR